MTQLKRKTSATCLAVIRDKPRKGEEQGRLIFAADRRVSWSHMRFQKTVRSKITKRNGIIFAGTGVSYICDLIGELSSIPEAPQGVDSFNYIHNYLQPSLVQSLQRKGFADEKGKTVLPKEAHSCVLIGHRGNLYEADIDSEFGVAIDPIDTEYATGCGGYYASGSLSTSQGLDLKTLHKLLRLRGYSKLPKTVEEARLSLAITVAGEHSGGCDTNVDIVYED